ncbi:MAG: hypothetical protein SFW35_08120 [Chitinophagales bacterium]|nr:hypothetical protein [Chitinophagales bacterium]
MQHPYGKLTIGLLFFLLSLSVSAQEVSPYSRFGLGDAQSTDFAAVGALGGASAAYQDWLGLNYNNPASYSKLQFTTFELGIKYGLRSIKATDSTYTSSDAFLDYFAMALPFGKRKAGGLTFGIAPFTQVSYSQLSEVSDSTVGSFTRLFNGDGRTYKLFVGSGWEVLGSEAKYSKHRLSVGANANLLFGKLRYSQIINFPDSSNTLSTRQTTNARVADAVFDVGVQYTLWLKRPSQIGSQVKINGLDSLVYLPIDTVIDWRKDLNKKTLYDKKGFIDSLVKVRRHAVFMTIGAYASVPLNTNAGIEKVYDRLVYTSSGLLILDTLSFTSGFSLKLNVPAKFGFGFMFSQADKWKALVDVSYTTWKNFNSIITESVSFRNDIRTAIGLEYIPNAAAGSFIKRTFYRIGAYYDNGYLTIAGNDIREIGGSLGFGIPLKRERFKMGYPHLNISFEGGTRGTNANNLVSEKFFRGVIAITLNNKWFEQRRYD